MDMPAAPVVPSSAVPAVDLVPGPVPAVRRSRAPRRPVTLDQLPVWAGFGPLAGEPADADPGLDALLGGLNPEQRRAVTHGDGPLLVVAGPGTGKTEVITRRIAWLIATRRARPSEILALTFTDKAAAEMQLRVDQLVPYGFADTAISTFHAFGDRLVREFALEIGRSPDARVLSRADTIVLLREHLFELGLEAYLPLGDPTRFLGALATLFARCRDEDVSPARYAAYAAGLATQAEAAGAALGAAPDSGPADAEEIEALLESARHQAELARSYERYTVLLAERGVLDFGDQVSLALGLLRESPAIRSTVQARFRYILVDEFQDTNRAQSEIVTLLAQRHRNVTVVGDDDQSIYRFRGAAISNILGFRERHRGARTIVLRRNYRSSAPILDAAHRLIRFNDPDRLEARVGISKQLRPERASPAAPPVRRHAFASGAEEADWIAAELRRRIDAGATARDHAVLVRANADAEPILRSLNVAGVPWRFSGASGLYGQAEIRVLLAFLRAIADPASSADVYALAASPVYDLGGADLSAIMGSARRRHRPAWEVFEEVDGRPESLDVTDAGRRTVARFVGDLRRFRDLAHRRPAGEVLYAFLRDSGWLAALASGDSPAADEALANVARFFEIVRAESALLADDRAIFLARHLGTLIDAGDDPASADPDPDLDAVAVLTVHKAKGLEFPVVILPGLVAGRFPAAFRREPLALPEALADIPTADGDPHLREERRLFYVAMTRARDELILTHAVDYGGARARRISPFLLEALDLPISAATAGAGAVPADPLARMAAIAPLAAAPAVRDAGPIEGPLSLSHSSIDAYLSCPKRYHYGYVLRVPTAPHHSIVYGSALHGAVQEFHRAEARGRILTEPELIAAFEAAWTNEGFVSRDHELARLEAGRAALRRFRAARLEPGTVAPAWVEREFSFSLGGDRVRGRFDRVDIIPAAGAGPGGDTDVAALLADASNPGSGRRADVVEPSLDLLGRERVTITDYKSSDVRDPVKARQRARDSLQLQIYAIAYEAMTGRLPDAIQLHFLDSGLVGGAPVDPIRLDRARERIATAAAGIRARAYAPRPETMTCTYCPYREICPSSAVR
ncbi:MAG TPA: ATP-dependent DNA helicase [Candidatus Sulfomarinibacteraceae bacterium]|nr:ATP-dependent DNA helicase [Candidatus Sulfomarinibacteraceae bacterium]